VQLAKRIALSIIAGILSFFITPFLIGPYMPGGPFLGVLWFYIIPFIVFAVVFFLLEDKAKQ